MFSFPSLYLMMCCIALLLTDFQSISRFRITIKMMVTTLVILYMIQGKDALIFCLIVQQTKKGRFSMWLDTSVECDYAR